MLLSPSRGVAFAHYPKNAGCSVFDWFTSTFPDALHLDADNPHLGVRRGLEILATRRFPLLRLVRKVLPGSTLRACHGNSNLLILGVIRDPFESLVSLYEYWRRGRPGYFGHELMRTAKEGSFADFLQIAVREKRCPNYAQFFDVGGPAWKNTHLLDFNSLEGALTQWSRECGVASAARLARLNAAPGRLKSMDDYRREAGAHVLYVRNYFRWYYEHGVRIMIRGHGIRLGAV